MSKTESDGEECPIVTQNQINNTKCPQTARFVGRKGSQPHICHHWVREKGYFAKKGGLTSCVRGSRSCQQCTLYVQATQLCAHPQQRGAVRKRLRAVAAGVNNSSYCIGPGWTVWVTYILIELVIVMWGAFWEYSQLKWKRIPQRKYTEIQVYLFRPILGFIIFR